MIGKVMKGAAIGAAALWVGCVWLVGVVLLDLNANFEEDEDAATGTDGPRPAER